jgi:hypothetical protein
VQEIAARHAMAKAGRLRGVESQHGDRLGSVESDGNQARKE